MRVSVNLIGAFRRAAGNTSNGLECPAFGGIDIEWATEDVTQGDVQEPQRTLVLAVEEVPALPSPKRLRAGRSKPPARRSSVPTVSRGIFLRNVEVKSSVEFHK
jgi:hypothetical protein